MYATACTQVHAICHQICISELPHHADEIATPSTGQRGPRSKEVSASRSAHTLKEERAPALAAQKEADELIEDEHLYGKGTETPATPAMQTGIYQLFMAPDYVFTEQAGGESPTGGPR